MNYKASLLFLLITLISFSCKKEKEKEEPAIEAGYFRADINGSPVEIEECNDTIFSSPYSSRYRGDTLDSTIISLITTLGPLVYPTPSPPVKNHISIQVIYKFDNSDLTSTKYLIEPQFRDLVSIGKYPFSFLPFYKSGIRISYNDHKGEQWISSKYFSLHGFGSDSIPNTIDYSTFNFEIYESTVATPGPNINWEQNVKIRFNCFLYNIKGDSIEIKNGEFKGKFNYYSK